MQLNTILPKCITRSSYIVYDSEGLAVKRVDVIGDAHNVVPTPHVIDFGRNIYKNSQGQIIKRAHKPRTDPRAATAEEIP